MEALLVLLALGFLAVPFVALFMAWGASSRISATNDRISALMAQLSAMRDDIDRLRKQPLAGVTGETVPESKPDATTEETADETIASGPWSEKTDGGEIDPAEELARQSLARERTKAASAGGQSVSDPGIVSNAADAQGNIPGQSQGGSIGGGGVPPVPPKSRSWDDFEQLVGARWSVLLGGFAVALGAIFLVKYSIDAGLLGPAARVTLGALFSAALLAGGEWLRRRDSALALPVMAKADIPGILTGAGAVAAFATVYAAYALYGFIGPAVAFIALTLVGIATLVGSALHGPKLAALGVVGSYATPLLVSTSEPNPYALAIHVLVVTASVLGTARLRGWLWLAMAGVAGGTAWTALAATMNPIETGLAGIGLLIGLGVMFAAAFGYELAERPQPPALTTT